MEGREKKEIKWHRLLSIVLSLTLLVGLAGLFGLLAPAPALAAGGSLTIEGPGLVIQDPDGDGTPGVTITQYQLRGTEALPPALQQLTGWTYLPQHDELYSTINTWPTKNFYRGKGVKLTDLLQLAGGLNDQATLIKFIASDGFAATFTVRELVYEPRYRYPNFMYDEHGNWNQAGHIIGDTSGEVLVEPMIAWKSGSSPYPEDLSDEENLSTADANHLLYGQRAVTQQTNARFAKYTTKIQVLTDPVQKWANPTANVPPGEVPVGNKVELHSPYDDEDKVHYTLDGSDPTIHSPMYNWIAKRWWSSRSDVLEEINRPIEITKNTVIKAFVTGPGREDSDIVTFEYTVPTIAVTGVSIAEGDQAQLTVGQTLQLTANVQPENATNKAVTWSSSDEAVATVSEAGLLTAVGEGTATITVTTEDGDFTDSITVNIVLGEPDIPPALTADTDGNEVGQAIDITFTDDAAWRAAITGIKVGGIALTSEKYTVAEGKISIIADVFTAAGEYEIVVSATGYLDATVTQPMVAAPAVAPVAAFTADTTSGTAPLTVHFTDQSTGNPTSWAWDFDNDGIVDSTDQNPTHEYSTAGTYSVKLTVTNAAGSDDEVKPDYITVSEPESPAIDLLYDGTVTLTPGETFTVTAYNSSVVYTVYETTPLGALQAAATAGGFTYRVTDKNYSASEALLLDDVGTYTYKNPGKWYAYVNDVYKDGYNNPAGALNLIEVANGDRVEFYYAANITDPTDINAVKAAATAAVKTVVSIAGSEGGGTPTDWTLQLSGANEATVTKSFFEQALACSSSGHQVTWTDSDNNVWAGVPLWLLVAMVDDDPDVGPYHFNFNDDLAARHYEVNVISGDGWKATFDSADIAHNNGYIVANTLNGEPLPLQTESGKPCWPLHLKGEKVFGGQQVGNIVRIELSGLPQPSEGWTLELRGDVGDTITQEEFEEALACTASGHYREWTDKDDNVWSGVPLWVLLGAVDDIEEGDHWTFNDARAAEGYTVKVVAEDGFTKTFDGKDIAKSDDYIVANKCNGEPLTDSWPLRLVGDSVAKADGSLGDSAVGNIVKIEILELQTPEAAPGSWNLTLTGKISDVISQAEFEAALSCPNSGHLVEWTDKDGNVWSGIPLWYLTGWVDDRQPHDYNTNQAMAGYKILVKAGDGYTKDFASTDVAWSNNYIIANKCNGEPLTGSSWPLRLVGAGVTRADGSLSGASVGNIVEIELTDFQTALPIPEVRIVKYAEDGTTIINEMTVDYLWMQEHLEVIGDGKTAYRFEAITNNPDDVWDADETYPGGFKIENAVMGTRIRDLCELVGGMGAGTEIVLVARDGYETRLPYSSIYTDPAVQARQGDAILAWWADGKYVPYYKDGMRLFFTPEDCVYGQWDMHETLPSNYWHYYYSDGVQYPSCAGLAAKWITEIKIYSVPEGDWTLTLDGRDIGGIKYEVSKTYFEQALACQFGANHKATYTDSKGRVWEGMPLWFLAGFVDDADQHSNNAFNEALAAAGYQVVIAAADGYSVTIDSADIIRNSDYIIANSLNGQAMPDDYWPLRLVGPAVSGQTSIAKIVSIKLVPAQPYKPKYNVVPVEDDIYTIGETQDDIKTMTVKPNKIGFKYFTVSIQPVEAHEGTETVVFTHLRNGEQLELNATVADFDEVDEANAGFNVHPGDVVKVFIVDQLTNDPGSNPVILQ